MSPDDDQLDLSELRTLSAQEVADATGVPIETVWSAAKNGSLYGRKLGREWRFTIPAVKEWIGVSAESGIHVPEPGKAGRPASGGTGDERPERGSSPAAKRGR
jgi:excisionase family DNA binding protein